MSALDSLIGNAPCAARLGGHPFYAPKEIEGARAELAAIRAEVERLRSADAQGEEEIRCLHARVEALERGQKAALAEIERMRGLLREWWEYAQDGHDCNSELEDRTKEVLEAKP